MQTETSGPSLRARLRYWFDNSLSSGTGVMILWLALGTIALILVVSTVIAIARITGEPGGTPLGFGEALWLSMLRTLDPGTMGGDQGWGFRIASLVVTLGGLLIVSSLIGLLASGISDRVAELRRGRSPVTESGHTLILGWSPKVFPIVSELVIANENQRHSSVVVLAPVDKTEMDEQLAARVEETKRTRLICRTGTPYEPVDLEIVRPEHAKAIIVLNPGGEDGDAEVVKATLALMRAIGARPQVPLVAEIHGSATAAALEEGTKGAVTVVRSGHVIARVTAQVCRQPGLSQVYQELLDFEGDEIYFSELPAITGTRFGDALLGFPNATLLGIRHADGTIAVHPNLDATFGEGDRIIAIAADDDNIDYQGPQRSQAPARAHTPHEPPSERILLAGWNEIAPDIIQELDAYVAPGSKLLIAVDHTLVSAEQLAVPSTLKNLTCSVAEGDLSRSELRELVRTEGFDHVVVLCYREGLTPAQADARVLLTLLHLRGAIEASGADTNIVAELLDERDVQLTPAGLRDEFIVSERLTALLMAQLSENRELAPVFEDLFDEAGSEIYLKPISLYMNGGESVAYGDLAAAAAARGEIALGYQQSGVDDDQNVVVNPRKDAELTVTGSDCLIVLSEDDG